MTLHLVGHTAPPEYDPWDELRRHTAARIALGRSGAGLPTRELLGFGLAHAKARDAVHLPLDVPALQQRFADMGCETLTVRSAAEDRSAYLLRPDLGRRLHPDDAVKLSAHATDSLPDLLLVVGDGLSSQAVERQAAPLLSAILKQTPPNWRLGPVVIATQARVALADEIGERLRARMVAMLIGERPGLSSPDSLGIYLTWDPRPGRHDAQRNCISNVRPEGLAPELAAAKMWWLCVQARRLELTGVGLKDLSDSPSLPDVELPGLDG